MVDCPASGTEDQEVIATNVWPFVIAALSLSDVPEPPPPAVTLTNPPIYFAATSQGPTNSESAYSNEVVWNSTNRPPAFSFSWNNPTTPTNCWITNYMLYCGPSSGTYIHSNSMGTNQPYIMWLVRTNTNLVVTVSWPGFSLSLTNPTDAPRYWTNAGATITKRWQ